MANRRFSRYSGIGGQAVLEGVMMKNKEKYAVAVRKPDGEIEVELAYYHGLLRGSKWKELPFVRGIFNFVDSLVLGMKALNYSSSFYEDETEAEKKGNSSHVGEKTVTALVTIFSVVLAVGLFIVLPYYISSLFEKMLMNSSLMAVIEGIARIAIFLLYVWGIGLMKDIRRLYRYHGAEHKCINCIERGRPLTVRNVMRSSRFHKRCGTSFIFFVLIVSVVLFFFIRVDNVLQRIGLRILLMPVVAGISYEFIWLTGRSNNFIMRILSLPGMLIQRLTTKEPDTDMVEVAIASVEAVFDWKNFLLEHFGYDVDGDFVKEHEPEEAVGEGFIVEELMTEDSGRSGLVIRELAPEENPEEDDLAVEELAPEENFEEDDLAVEELAPEEINEDDSV